LPDVIDNRRDNVLEIASLQTHADG